MPSFVFKDEKGQELGKVRALGIDPNRDVTEVTAFADKFEMITPTRTDVEIQVRGWQTPAVDPNFGDLSNMARLLARIQGLENDNNVLRQTLGGVVAMMGGACTMTMDEMKARKPEDLQVNRLPDDSGIMLKVKDLT